MNKVELVADDDERKLVRKLRLFEEVLDFLGVIEVALPANALDLSDLTGASGGLDILEMNLWILTQVDNRTEVVIET
jgi:hypothetical protein